MAGQLEGGLKSMGEYVERQLDESQAAHTFFEGEVASTQAGQAADHAAAVAAVAEAAGQVRLGARLNHEIFRNTSRDL